MRVQRSAQQSARKGTAAGLAYSSAAVVCLIVTATCPAQMQTQPQPRTTAPTQSDQIAITARVAAEVDGEYRPAPQVVDGDPATGVTELGSAVVVLDFGAGVRAWGGLKLRWAGRPPAAVIVEQSGGDASYVLVRSIEAPDFGALAGTTWTITPGAGARYMRLTLLADDRVTVGGARAAVGLAEVSVLDASLGKSVIALVKLIAREATPGLFPRAWSESSLRLSQGNNASETPTTEPSKDQTSSGQAAPRHAGPREVIARELPAGGVYTEPWPELLLSARGVIANAPAPAAGRINVQLACMVDGELLTWATPRGVAATSGAVERGGPGASGDGAREPRVVLTVEPDATGRAGLVRVSNPSSKTVRGELRLCVRGPAELPPRNDDGPPASEPVQAINQHKAGNAPDSGKPTTVASFNDEQAFALLGLGTIEQQRDGALLLDGTHRLRVTVVSGGAGDKQRPSGPIFARLGVLVTGDALASDTRFTPKKVECPYRWATAVVPLLIDLPPAGELVVRLELEALGPEPSMTPPGGASPGEGPSGVGPSGGTP